MTASLAAFVGAMRKACDEWSLGYDQSNRWDIRDGGECDCSSLIIWALKQGGFDVGSASYTGDLSENLTARGWERILPNGQLQVGDILLNDAYHAAVCTAPGMMSYASLNETGSISEGESGDQTGRETRTVAGFAYSRGWNCYLRYTKEGGGTSDTPKASEALVVDGWWGRLPLMHCKQFLAPCRMDSFLDRAQKIWLQ